MLAETHLTNEIEDTEMSIDQCKLFRTDSSSRHTGGVAIYVNSEITVLNTESIVEYMNMWLLALKIKWNSMCVVVACVYHSPNSSHDLFISELSKWIQKK